MTALFHLTTTVPVALQILIQLVRAAVHLTVQRDSAALNGSGGSSGSLSENSGSSRGEPQVGNDDRDDHGGNEDDGDGENDAAVSDEGDFGLFDLPKVRRVHLPAPPAPASPASPAAAAAAALAATTTSSDATFTKSFHHLLAKEVGRAVTTGALAVGLLAALPALVEDGLLQKRWAVAAALFAFDGASALFGVLSKLAIAFFQATLGAVPVLTFEAVESHGKVGLPPPPPQTPPPTPPPTRSSSLQSLASTSSTSSTSSSSSSSYSSSSFSSLSSLSSAASSKSLSELDDIKSPLPKTPAMPDEAAPSPPIVAAANKSLMEKKKKKRRRKKAKDAAVSPSTESTAPLPLSLLSPATPKAMRNEK